MITPIFTTSELVEANPVAKEVYDVSSEKYAKLQESTQMKEEYKIHLETRPNSPHRKDQSQWTKEDWRNFHRDRDDFMRAYMAKKHNKLQRPDRTRSPKLRKEDSESPKPAEDAARAGSIPREASVTPDNRPSFQDCESFGILQRNFLRRVQRC